MLLVLFMLPESHTAEQRRTHAGAGGPRLHALQLLRKLPGLRWLALGTLLTTFSQSTLESIFAIWAMNRYHIGPRSVGMTLFVLAIVAVGVQGGLVGRLARRFGEYRLTFVAIACYALGLTIVAASHMLPLVIIGLMCCGLGAGLFNPSGSALASRESQPSNRGAVMGTYQIGTSMARVLAPLLSGPVYMRFGPSAPFLLAAVVTLQAGWCMLAVRRVHAAANGSGELSERRQGLR